MLCSIPDQLKFSVWGSETCGIVGQRGSKRNRDWSLSEYYINCLPFHPPIFSFQQPHTKERSLVSFTWWRQPLSALLSPSPYKPSSPQGGRCSQAVAEGASHGPPARAWWVVMEWLGQSFLLGQTYPSVFEHRIYLGKFCHNGWPSRCPLHQRCLP